MKRTKKNPKPIYTGRKAPWSSANALFLNSANHGAITVDSTVGRYDIFAPVSEGEDLLKAFEPDQGVAEVTSEDLDRVLTGLLNSETLVPK